MSDAQQAGGEFSPRQNKYAVEQLKIAEAYLQSAATYFRQADNAAAWLRAADIISEIDALIEREVDRTANPPRPAGGD